ncbi:hypothetical protein MasN3_15840 [Massilia varians]|uniref:Uncharacterized protein n=1 Tax=Massilia varians TaxID=457921 RepID=A0ABM8C4F7_9BURK|nr:hypothetical protein MasN3_15840 [Massilia varians]
MNFRRALAIAALVDYDNRRREREDRQREYEERRRRNHEEQRERLISNIERWEASMVRVQEKLQRTLYNRERNRERLSKALAYLDRLNSEKTKTWLERQHELSQTHRSVERRTEAKARIQSHEEKIRSVTEQIVLLNEWLREGNELEYGLRCRISELQSKISDGRYKLTGI